MKIDWKQEIKGDWGVVFGMVAGAAYGSLITLLVLAGGVGL